MSEGSHSYRSFSRVRSTCSCDLEDNSPWPFIQDVSWIRGELSSRSQEQVQLTQTAQPLLARPPQDSKMAAGGRASPRLDQHRCHTNLSSANKQEHFSNLKFSNKLHWREFHLIPFKCDVESETWNAIKFGGNRGVRVCLRSNQTWLTGAFWRLMLIVPPPHFGSGTGRFRFPAELELGWREEAKRMWRFLFDGAKTDARTWANVNLSTKKAAPGQWINYFLSIYCDNGVDFF